MSLWDSLFKKKTPESRVIDQGEFSNLLLVRLRAGQETVFKGSRNIINEVLRNTSIIGSEVRVIETLEIPDDIPVKLRRIVKTSRPSFVTGVMESINPFLGRKVSDYTDVEQLHTDLGKCLDSLAKVHISQGRYLPAVFEKEIKAIKKASKNLLDCSSRLEKIVEKSTKGNRLLNETIDQYKEIKESLKESDSIESSLQASRERIDSLIKRGNRLREAMEELSDSTESRILSGQKKEISEAKAGIDKLENRVYNLLTPMKRPLKKYRKQAFETDKKTEKRIDLYIEDPVKEFFIDGAGGLISLLGKLGRYIQEDKLTLKDKEKKKILGKIKNIMDSDMDNIKREHQAILKRRDILSESLRNSPVTAEIESLSADLGGVGDETTLLQEDVEVLVNKRNNIIERVRGLRSRVEVNMSKMEGREIKVDWADHLNNIP